MVSLVSFVGCDVLGRRECEHTNDIWSEQKNVLLFVELLLDFSNATVHSCGAVRCWLSTCVHSFQGIVLGSAFLDAAHVNATV